MRAIDVLSAVLLVVGGLNWGLVGIFNFDLVAAIAGVSFGETNAFSRLVYILVAGAAVYQSIGLKSIQRRWGVAAPRMAGS